MKPEPTRTDESAKCGLRREAQRHAAFQTLGGARKAVSSLRSATALQKLAPLRLCAFAFLLLPISVLAATNDLTSALQRGLFEEEANHNLDAAAQAYQAVSAQFDKDRKLAATAIFRLGEVYRKQGKTNEASAQYERIVREFSDQQTLAMLSRQNLAGIGREPHSASSPERLDTSASVAAARNEALTLAAELERLKGMNSADLRIAVQQNYPNPVLTELMKQMSIAEQNLAGLRRDFSPQHPEVLKVAAQVEIIHKQINEQVDGAIKALEFKLETAKAVLTQLEKGSLPLSRASRLEQKQLLEQEIKLVEQDLAELKKQFTAGVVSQSEVRAKEREVLKLRQQVAALAVDAEDGSIGTFAAAAVTDEEEQEIRRIQALIQNSPDLINAGQNPPIFPAVEAGYLRVVRFLLDHGADVNARSQGATPLHVAAKRGQKAMAELLLSRGANVNARNTFENPTRKDRTPLHEAAEDGYQAVVEVLVANQADLTAHDADSNTPLHLAAKRNRANVVAVLAPKMSDLNAENSYGITALGFAAAFGSLDSIKALLDAKADMKAGQRDTPLLAAINYRRSSEVIEMLLRRGADANAAGKFTPPGHEMGRNTTVSFDTPLHLAAERGDPETIKLLLRFKADPNVVDGAGRSPLSRAVGNTNIVKLLLETKADPNLGRAESPLLLAVRADDPVLAEMLLRAGADPNQETKCDLLNPTPGTPFGTGMPTPQFGGRRSSLRSGQPGLRTPLQAAVLEDHPALVKLLLQFKGDPKANDAEGFPLVLSALGNAEALKALLEAGANANAIDSKGQHALITASRAGNSAAVDLLLKHGAKTEVRGEYGRTPLVWAIETGCVKCVESLLAAGADVDAHSYQSWKPLHTAVYHRHKEIVAMLLAKGANPNVREVTGQTPLGLTKPQYTGMLAPPPPGGEPRAQLEELAELLRQHGALDDLAAFDRIQVKRPSANVSKTIFRKGTNDWNQFSLLELIGAQYQFLRESPQGGEGTREDVRLLAMNDRRSDALLFPDLAHIRIRRPAADGKSWKEQVVDASAFLRSGDCSKDVPLQWGDEVLIPEKDHPLGAPWAGFSRADLKALQQCLTRSVEVVVKGQATKVTVGPKFEYLDGPSTPYVTTSAPIWIQPVLRGSNLLLSSSDLSRVKVTRRDTTGKAREWILDCSDPKNTPAFWLRDGDVIEVPDKP